MGLFMASWFVVSGNGLRRQRLYAWKHICSVERTRRFPTCVYVDWGFFREVSECFFCFGFVLLVGGLGLGVWLRHAMSAVGECVVGSLFGSGKDECLTLVEYAAVDRL